MPTEEPSVTIPFYCVLIAFLLIPLTKVPVGIAQAKVGRGYDNKDPRGQQAQLTGWGKRAHGAHNNTIEAFPGFAAGVLIAHLGGADADRSAMLAVIFVVARLIYPALYIANVDKVRSLVWSAGLFASIGLMLLPALK